MTEQERDCQALREWMAASKQQPGVYVVADRFCKTPLRPWNLGRQQVWLEVTSQGQVRAYTNDKQQITLTLQPRDSSVESFVRGLFGSYPIARVRAVGSLEPYRLEACYEVEEGL